MSTRLVTGFSQLRFGVIRHELTEDFDPVTVSVARSGDLSQRYDANPDPRCHYCGSKAIHSAEAHRKSVQTT
jgi:hypothetical protein